MITAGNPYLIPTYSKEEIDALLAEKADTGDSYTKTETDTLLAAKADSDDVYTKTAADTLLAGKADTTDGRFFNWIGQLDANGSLEINCENSVRNVLFVFRGSTAQGVYMINTSATGTVSVATIAEVQNISITTAANKITIANSASSISQVYMMSKVAG